MSPDLCVIPAQAEIHFEQSVGYPPSRVWHLYGFFINVG
jgi:hypothetical protein